MIYLCFDNIMLMYSKHSVDASGLTTSLVSAEKKTVIAPLNLKLVRHIGPNEYLNLNQVHLTSIDGLLTCVRCCNF